MFLWSHINVYHFKIKFKVDKNFIIYYFIIAIMLLSICYFLYIYIYIILSLKSTMSN